MRLLLTLLCFHITVPAFAGDGKLRLRFGDEVYSLHRFVSTDPRRPYSGVYAFPTEYTGGTMLHLFPNGRFVVISWMDIGSDELHATGSYEVRDDRLALKFSRITPGHEDVKKRFADLHLLYGRIEKKDPKLGVEYVTGFEVFIFTAKGWKTIEANPKKTEYLRRHTEYPDWEKIFRDYEAQKQ